MLYLGSYTSTNDSVNDGLTIALAAPHGLKRRHSVPGVTDASFFAISGDKNTLYVTNESPTTGSITALNRTNPHRPRIVGVHSTQGLAPTHVSVHPSQRYLLTAHYGDGTICVHPIRQNGGLSEPTDVVSNATTQAHAHQILTDPTGKWILVVDLGTDSVYVYRIDVTSGKLEAHDKFDLPPGFGPRHLDFHPNHRIAYILGELRAEVVVAQWDHLRGALTISETVPTVTEQPLNPVYPAEILVSPDGDFVYVSNRGEDTLVTFSVGRSGADLTKLASVPTGGNWPRHFILDPARQWFYIANQKSGTVTWMPRDPTTGLPGPVAGSLDVPSVAAILLA